MTHENFCVKRDLHPSPFTCENCTVSVCLISNCLFKKILEQPVNKDKLIEGIWHHWPPGASILHTSRQKENEAAYLYAHHLYTDIYLQSQPNFTGNEPQFYNE